MKNKRTEFGAYVTKPSKKRDRSCFPQRSLRSQFSSNRVDGDELLNDGEDESFQGLSHDEAGPSQVLDIQAPETVQGQHFTSAFQSNPPSTRPPRSQEERNAARHENWGAAYSELKWHLHASRGSEAASKQRASHLLMELQLKQYQGAVNEAVEDGCSYCGGNLCPVASRSIKLVDVQSSVEVPLPCFRCI